MSGADMIDWDLAVGTARRLVKPGPQVGFAQAADVVAQLRTLAAEADGHVRTFTRLDPPPDAPPIAVVDRNAWVVSNVEGFKVVLEPVIDKLQQVRPASGSALVAALGRRLTGVQVGTLLAFLSSRVLGQYEIFLPEHLTGGRGHGRLSLVAPNIVEVERALDVDPHDFRLWVCLHEVTHRTQFTAVPWLRGHVESELQAFIDASDLDPAVLAARLRAALAGLTEAIRNRTGASVLELVQTPEQRVVLDRVQAFMSLVEGHAEYVMDGVGPTVVPSIATIRARFNQRRSGLGPLDRIMRRLLGLDLKMRQYADGARFVAGVVDIVGMDGFNRVWESPATLPSKAEIADPAGWVERVHGIRPAVPA
ncbi:MAG: zinc-dependent metalloprotease [Mycobacteriales bacterium]